MIIAYLAIIAYFLSDELDSTRHVVAFATLWILGVVALVLLARSWRHARA
jgi:multisubunit Na+/H+ antiporter MnhG subunit